MGTYRLFFKKYVISNIKPFSFILIILLSSCDRQYKVSDFRKEMSFNVNDLKGNASVYDFFEDGSYDEVDLLITVDNSSSMHEAQEALHHNFSVFVARLNQSIDFRVAIVTSDSSELVGKTCYERNNSENTLDQIPQAIDSIGTRGSKLESPLYYSLEAFKKLNLVPGCFRNSAAKVLLVVTSENECIPGAISTDEDPEPSIKRGSINDPEQYTQNWYVNEFRGLGVNIYSVTSHYRYNGSLYFGNDVRYIVSQLGGIDFDILSDYGALFTELAAEVNLLSNDFIIPGLSLEDLDKYKIEVYLRPKKSNRHTKKLEKGFEFQEVNGNLQLVFNDASVIIGFDSVMIVSTLITSGFEKEEIIILEDPDFRVIDLKVYLNGSLLDESEYIFNDERSSITLDLPMDARLRVSYIEVRR